MISATARRISALTLILSLGLFLFLIGVENRLVKFEDSMTVETPSLYGFEEVKKGSFRAVSGQSEFHSYSIPITLVANDYYRIRYDIDRLPREKIIVTADFFAPGYDNPEQETAELFGMNALGTRQEIIFNSGKSPTAANFRLFYSGPQGFEIKNIEIAHVAAWSIWFKRSLIAAALGALLIMAMSSIKRFHARSVMPLSLKTSVARISTAEFPALATVYFGAVLIRYMIYIMIPYWSGDEYAYKSIAAGIWHFGSHGVLTDEMVAHSVNLPNLLYPYLISPAFLLGENFYFGVRLINAIIINTAIFPIYFMARRFLNQMPALVVASISIAIPFLNIGAFAVTEVLFFPLFLLSILMAIESIDHPLSIRWNAIFGVVVAILLNVRLNALVLLPAFLFSILWISVARGNTVSLLKRPYWLVSIIAFFCVHVCLQFFLSVREIGSIGLYSHIATKNDDPISVIVKSPIEVFNLIAGHLTTLAIPYALPLALILFSVVSSRNKWVVDGKFRDFLIVTIIFSLAMFLLTLIFTIRVSPIDLGGLGRWHSRYYFYFYPLLIIAGAVFLKQMPIMREIDRCGVVFSVILMLFINIYFIKLYGGLDNPWFGSIVDNMDVQWYRSVGQFYWLFIGFTGALLWLWYKRSRFFFGGMVIFFFTWGVVSNLGALRVAGLGSGAKSDTCGNFSGNFLARFPGRFVIAADSRATMVDAAFWNPYIPERTILHGDSSRFLDSVEVGASTDFLIVNGAIQVDPSYRPLISLGKCVIYELSN